jgi:hypothetical protein
MPPSAQRDGYWSNIDGRVSLFKKVRVALGVIAGLLALSLGGIRDTHAATIDQRPCDIYAAGGTPCVAAHSTYLHG